MAPQHWDATFAIAGDSKQPKRKLLWPGNKVLVLGSSGVGKTQLLLRLAGSPATDAAIHGDFLTRIQSVGDARAPVKLELWHTAGQEKFGGSALPATLFRRARAAVIVYDVADRQSFLDVSAWVSQLRGRLEQQSALHAPFTLVLVGNQTVRAPEVSSEEGRRLAQALGALAFMECCTATGENVQRCLQTLADGISSPTLWHLSRPASVLDQSANKSSGKFEPAVSVAAMPLLDPSVVTVVPKILPRARAVARSPGEDSSPIARAA